MKKYQIFCYLFSLLFLQDLKMELQITGQLFEAEDKFVKIEEKLTNNSFVMQKDAGRKLQKVWGYKEKEILRF